MALCFACVAYAADEYPLIYENDFEKGMGKWIPTDSKAWELREEEGNHVLALVSSSEYAPPVRSPLSINRIEGLDVTDFVIDVEVKQTGRDYGHRDFCIFFGYQDPSHFYYVHLATKADDHANSIFLVNGEARVSVAQTRTSGTVWDKKYHKIRIERDTEKGSIRVFVDDMDTPAMTTIDKHFLHGGIGFGSFDDTGNIDNIKIWGKKTGASEP